MRDVLGGAYVIDLEASGDGLAGRLAGIAGVINVTTIASGRWRVDADRDVRAAVAKAVVEAGGELRALSIASASLEDVYTRYFEGVRHAA
jgi:ABC-2 type transport system ATP-binding protein